MGFPADCKAGPLAGLPSAWFSVSHPTPSIHSLQTAAILIPEQIFSDADWEKELGQGGQGLSSNPQAEVAIPSPTASHQRGTPQSELLSGEHFKNKEEAGPFAKMHLGSSASS